MAIDLSKAFNRLDHSKLLTLLFDLGVPPCALRMLRSYLTNRTMCVHLDDAISDVYELWGGGPQGGLLTVLLFNLNSNFITDICQPGLTQESRFLCGGKFAALRCARAQLRDCPPYLPGFKPHMCLHKVPCLSTLHRQPSSVHLCPEVSPFVPGASLHQIPQNACCCFEDAVSVGISLLTVEATPFVPGAVCHTAHTTSSFMS